MKTFLMVSVLLALLVVGVHVEQELDRYQVSVGEDADVLVRVGNTGESALDVSVVPGVHEGLTTLNPGVQSMEITPGNSALVSYSVRGERPGQYTIASQVIYTDDEGRSRQMRCGDKSGRLLVVS
ncbi:MAG: hypothetical protein WCY97_04100 [Methanothrix sp.]|jgi:uncharacterized protein (DUF58 family)|nr:hypothetical protein [Methanothrix harundinacea]MDD2638020.1 hypothetical protein [Methanothrix sp.]MDD3709484.1 hypothetical protein [Methanothrix sp.]MDI9399462.1 hypothetical protein [Euryarchaeota archaeon]